MTIVSLRREKSFIRNVLVQHINLCQKKNRSQKLRTYICSYVYLSEHTACVYFLGQR